MKGVIHVGDKCGKDINIRINLRYRITSVSSLKISQVLCTCIVPNIIDSFIALVENVSNLSALRFLYGITPT